MNQEKSVTTKNLWVGLRCLNAGCKRDFPACSNGDKLIAQIALDANEKAVVDAANALLGKLSPVLDAISALHGAKALASGAINISPALQHCSHCGRWYFYPYSDYFVTMEDMPKIPD